MVGILERIIAPRLQATNVNDERVWGGSSNSAAGINVTPEVALTYSAFFACVRVISEDESTIPLGAFQEVGDSRIPRPDHSIDHLLDEQSNPRQTAQEFREWMTAVCAMRGEALAEIRGGRRGFADALEPMDPNRTRKETLPSKGVRYRYREETGQERIILSEDVFRLPGPMGMPIVTLARETLGAAIAGDQFTSATWKNGIKPRMGLQHPKTISKEAQERLRDSVDQDHGGARNAGKTLLFEEGMTWVKVGIDPKDAQFLESRQFSVEEVCRWFRVPPHMIAHLLHATFSNIEHQGIDYVKHAMRPWCVRWEKAAKSQLILEPDIYVRHNMDALLRGDRLSQATAFEIDRRMGVRNANEIRALMELNPRDDPLGAKFWDIQPGTGSGSGAPPNGGKARALAEAAAHRVVNREKLALADRAKKHGDDWSAWQASVTEFYQGHVAMVRESLCISEESAKAYCDEKAETLIRDGLKLTDGWDTSGLADLALEGSE